MAALAGSSQSYDIANSMREDLEDTIWDLFPMDTWCLTNLDKVEATATLHEWQLDALDAATVNQQVEANDGSYTTIVQPSRYTNSTQISAKYFLISGTAEAVKKAGMKSQVARLGMKKMRELKRDIEKAVCTNQGMCTGSNGVARISAGMESWIASTDHGGNSLRATTTNAGSTIGYSSNTVSAPVDGGSLGGLSQTQFNQMLQEAWTDGGDARIVLVGATYKSAIDAFTSQATRTVDVDSATQIPILSAANVYISDFGKHAVVLSRYVRNTAPGVVLAIDPEFWAIAFLRRPFMETLAKTGDGEKRMILSEFCLVARNPNSSAKITGLT